jgi:hypothetical protein
VVGYTLQVDGAGQLVSATPTPVSSTDVITLP